MTLGLSEAARKLGYQIDVRLAVDTNKECIEIYKNNFTNAKARVADVSALFNGVPGTAPSRRERALARTIGRVDILTGGPPCQGHSDLNNHTRRKDPKNALYLRMARAAEILKPRAVIIENVANVQWDVTGVVDNTVQALVSAGYEVARRVLDLTRVGVPQTRKRHVVVASRVKSLKPQAGLTALANNRADHHGRSVRWAIHDLLSVAPESVFDMSGAIRETNARRIDYLFENKLYDLPNLKRPDCHKDGNHSYKSVYGRLRWNMPSQTITTGFGCMGQGRYVPPQLRRTITAHEAARLQTFPDWFDFGRPSGDASGR
jgi:DNA (cytosine-5)-methyltransferase 1